MEAEPLETAVIWERSGEERSGEFASMNGVNVCSAYNGNGGNTDDDG